MEYSILDTIKKLLGLDPSYTAFDIDIITLINTVFATLNQMGIGRDGFTIEDSSDEWMAFISNNAHFEPVKTYTYLRVRKIFDPPSSSSVMTAMDDTIRELEWRLYSEANYK